MGAPKGNQYWKLRSKHGRDKIIQDPETLAEASDEYFQWCLDNPLETKDYKGKDATQVTYQHPRPFLKNELARFCGVAQWRTLEELKDHKEYGKDFSQILARIDGIIADQKYTYAVINVFNHTIVARDLGLADKQDISGGQPIVVQSSNDKEAKENQDAIDNLK